MFAGQLAFAQVHTYALDAPHDPHILAALFECSLLIACEKVQIKNSKGIVKKAQETRPAWDVSETHEIEHWDTTMEIMLSVF